MSHPDNLFLLIKSLTKSEKRYFKLYMSVQKGEKNYLKLFNLLEKIDEYDEEKIRIEFKGERFLRQLHVQKNYLYNLILKTLRNYGVNSSVNIRINGALMDIDWLFQKSLYTQARSLLQREKKTALKYERFELLLELYGKEIQYKIRPFEGINMERKEVIAKLNRFYKVEKNYQRMFELSVKMGESRSLEIKEKYKKVFDESIQTTQGEIDSIRSVVLQYNLIALYYSVVGNFKKNIFYLEKIEKVYKDNPWLLDENRFKNSYGSLLANMGSNYLRMGNVDKAEYFFNQLISSRNISNHFFLSAVLPSLINLMWGKISRGSFKEGQNIYNAIENDLKKFDWEATPNPIAPLLYYFMGIICFGLGKYKDALKWVLKLINIPSLNQRDDIQVSARILYLIIFYEMKKSILDYQLSSSTKFLIKKNRLGGFEKKLLNFFLKDDFTGKDRKTIKESFLVLRDQLKSEVYINETPDATEQLIVFSWIDSKILGCSFAEAIAINDKLKVSK